MKNSLFSMAKGAFLIPYFVMLFICGIPLLYMELAVGQLTKRGPVGAMISLCPLFQGFFKVVSPMSTYSCESCLRLHL